MSPSWFDGQAMLVPPARGTVRERQRARLTAARAARGDADILRHYLDALALYPAQDADVTYSRPTTIWGSDYLARRSEPRD